MVDSMKREIGGNTITLWRSRINGRISEFFRKKSERLKKKGSQTIITNPTCKFINHCTMLFSFTVDTNEKYQLIHQGKFTKKYKDWRKRVEEQKLRIEEWEASMEAWEEEDPDTRGTAPVKPDTDVYPLTTEEMFLTIIPMQKSWYKKETT
jgi:hypothetical protein